MPRLPVSGKPDIRASGGVSQGVPQLPAVSVGRTHDGTTDWPSDGRSATPGPDGGRGRTRRGRGRRVRPALRGAGGRSGAPIVDPGSQLIGCDQAADRVTVTASAHLDPACIYAGGFDISTSGVVLDCRGAHVEDPEGDDRIGILVSAPTTVALSDVTVRNCFVKGFLNNARVSREGFKSLVQGSEYDAPFSNITIVNTHRYQSRGGGRVRRRLRDRSDPAGPRHRQGRQHRCLPRSRLDGQRRRGQHDLVQRVRGSQAGRPTLHRQGVEFRTRAPAGKGSPSTDPGTTSSGATPSTGNGGTAPTTTSSRTT